MRLGLWTGFFLLENSTNKEVLSVVLDNVTRLKKAGFIVGELDERNAYSLFVKVDEKEAIENAKTLKNLNFFTQLHAPKPSKDLTEQVLIEDRILQCSSIMGIKTVVIHPFITYEIENKEDNIILLERFSEKAQSYGINLSLENQIYSVDVPYYLEKIPSLSVNLDFAHALAIEDNVVEKIYQYGPKLKGLHVSDSDGRKEDYHIMPGEGILDWKKVRKALEDVCYKGDIHLEIVHERSENEAENDKKAREAFEKTGRFFKNES